MKRSLIILMVIIIYISTSIRLSGDDNIRILKNGFKVFCIHKKGAPIVNISIAVEAGAKFDGANPGTAHLLEHLILFRGGDSSDALRSAGADINGHTDNEAVTFEISLPSEKLSFALEFLHNLVYKFRIEEEEFLNEKKILIEEIRQMRDKPLIKARNIVVENVLRDTVYQYPLQGNEAGIESLEFRDMINWYKSHYVPDASSIVVVGDFSDADVLKEVDKYFGSLAGKRGDELNIAAAENISKRKIRLLYEDIEQGYVVAGFKAPAMNEKGGSVLRAFTGIISRGIYPLMGRAFLNRRRTATSCDVRYVSMINNGIILFEFSFDPAVSTPARVIATLEKFLQQMGKFRFSVEDYPPRERTGRFDFLKYIKNSGEFSRETFREKGINLARAYSRYIVLKKWYDKAGNSKVNTNAIHKLVRKYMLKGRYFSIAVMPEKYRKK